MSFSQSVPQFLPFLPPPGTVLTASPSFHPPIVRGLTIYPENSLRFDFIIDTGDNNTQGEDLKNESNKLIKYFLASLTIPEGDVWVNLSPYEKERIIPDNFGKTEMGRELLAQDYILKQLMASFLDPNQQTGAEFWKNVLQKAKEKYGSTDIPVNTFNKVWIVADRAVVYEDGATAYVGERHLKVMLEQDFMAARVNHPSVKEAMETAKSKDLGSTDPMVPEVIRSIVIPELEREVNQGEIFANLRQVFNSMILATWYKKKMKESLLGQIYADKNKLTGVNLDDPKVVNEIYQQYLAAYQKGVVDLVKEDFDETTQKLIERKYFSGGIEVGVVTAAKLDVEFLDTKTEPEKIAIRQAVVKTESSPDKGRLVNVETNLAAVSNGREEKIPTPLGQDTLASRTVTPVQILDEAYKSHKVVADYLDLLNKYNAPGEGMTTEESREWSRWNADPLGEINRIIAGLRAGMVPRGATEASREMMRDTTRDSLSPKEAQQLLPAWEKAKADMENLRVVPVEQVLNDLYENHKVVSDYLALLNKYNAPGEGMTVDESREWSNWNSDPLGEINRIIAGLRAGMVPRGAMEASREMMRDTTRDLRSPEQAQKLLPAWEKAKVAVENLQNATTRLASRTVPPLTANEIQETPNIVQYEVMKLMMRDVELAKALAQWQNDAYYISQGQTPPPFFTAQDTPADVNRKVGQNIAGVVALIDGIGRISETTGQSPVEVLQDIVSGKIPNENPEMVLLARFAHATWLAGQPFIGVARLQRPVVMPAQILPAKELEKDFVQVRKAANKFLEEIQKRFNAEYSAADRQIVQQQTEEFISYVQQQGPISEADLARIRKAADTVFFAHSSQKRMGGAPYATHPIRVAQINRQVFGNTSPILDLIAISHDMREDQPSFYEDLKNHVAQNVMQYQDQEARIEKQQRADALRLGIRVLSKLTGPKYEGLADAQTEYYQRLVNPRVAYPPRAGSVWYTDEFIRGLQQIKLADTIANVTDLESIFQGENELTGEDNAKPERTMGKITSFIIPILLNGSTQLTAQDRNAFYDALNAKLNEYIKLQTTATNPARYQALIDAAKKFQTEFQRLRQADPVLSKQAGETLASRTVTIDMVKQQEASTRILEQFQRQMEVIQRNNEIARQRNQQVTEINQERLNAMMSRAIDQVVDQQAQEFYRTNLRNGGISFQEISGTMQVVVENGVIKINPAATRPGQDRVGGIELNADYMDFQVIKRNGEGVPLPLPEQPAENLKSIEGFVPVIMNIFPLTVQFQLGDSGTQTQEKIGEKPS